MELSGQVHTLVAYFPVGESPVCLEYGRVLLKGKIPNRESNLARPEAFHLKISLINTVWFDYLTRTMLTRGGAVG
jgi:hypothetical protein